MAYRMIYAIPVLGRYGLTHGLLAWARCRLWCEQNGAKGVAPFWFKLRIGPYLRHERDKRNYFLLFHSGSALSGIGRLYVLARSRKVTVTTEWPAVPTDTDGMILLKFHNSLKNNEKESFSQVIGHGAFLRQELIAITRARYLPPPVVEPFIAIHVRMGDFSAPIANQGNVPATNTRLPIDWYGDRLHALRNALGRQVKGVVFSDGSDDDLATLLAYDNVVRAPRQQSITDLLAIGEGAALIASGSGFSLWGAFLGSVPRISYPGQSIVPIDIDTTRDIESDFGATVPADFVLHVRQRLEG